MKKCFIFVVMFTFVLGVTWTVRASAEDQTLAEKLLIILKANHDITQAQYDELLKEAEKEKAAQKAVVAKQVKAETVKAAKEYKEKHPLEVTASWKKHEVYFQSNDKNFTMHVGGYAQIDFGNSWANDQLKQLNTSTKTINGYGAEARRARITLNGSLYRDIDYKAQLEFAGGKSTITDLYLIFKEWPCFANIKVGHQKEPFSLEALTASSWYEFMERDPSFTFVSEDPNGTRNTGVQLYNTAFGKRMTWAVGGFIQQTNSSGTSFQDYDDTNIAARVTWLPWYADKGCELVHLGLGYRHLFRSANPENADLEFKSKPDFHLAGVDTVSTGLMSADRVDMLNPEAAIVYGPFSMQGEYFYSFLHNAYLQTTSSSGTAVGDPDVSGYYVFASYFLTGEHRNYNRNLGIFGRPIPLHNFSLRDGTWGAWEVALRYDSIDLNDGLLTGGAENDVTAALNWYLNPNVRWSLDYTYAHVYDRPLSGGLFINDGNANIIATRVQFNY